MLIRAKYFSIKYSDSFEEIVQSLNDRAYRDEIGSGFETIDTNGFSLTAKFFNKKLSLIHI